ncbi:MAG: type II CAAX endopeptidase family protein [Tissierellia bacterium]|nr:type II CAAX endopeptidase family protein [Tissierellia bacterium]
MKLLDAGDSLKGSRLFQMNLLFLVIALLSTLFSRLLPDMNPVHRLVLSEYLFLLLPVWGFLYLRKENPFIVLRLKPISWELLVYSGLIVSLLYPLFALSNLLLGSRSLDWIYGIGGGVDGSPGWAQILLFVFALCITPAICEEVVFRGLLMDGYKDLPRFLSLSFISIFFGMMHFNADNTIGPILLSIVLLRMVELSGSIFSAIIGHFSYNLLGLWIALFTGGIDGERWKHIPESDLRMGFLIGIVFVGISTFCAIRLWGIYRSKCRTMRRTATSNDQFEQISIEDYFGGELENKAISIVQILEFSPIIVFFLFYGTLL